MTHRTRALSRLPTLLTLASVLASAAWAQLPTAVKLTPAFGTDGANKFRYPVDFQEVQGLPGVFAVLEQGNASSSDKARIWLLEKDGAAYAKKEFLAIDVLKGGEEPGLLGLAFHPKFTENRRYFIYYVAPGGSSMLDERAADLTLRKDAGGSAKNLITFTRNRTNHNGGQLAFGKDGFLYAAFGEDGQYDPAQRLNTFLGKLVRLDVDKPAGGKNYGIPTDNPYANSTDANFKEIWAHGLRNPWRFSFDPATDKLWLADVGEKAKEEIDVVGKGDNLGWPQTEGTGCSSFYPSCTSGSYVAPIKDLKRDSSTCIVGGYIFRGKPTSEAFGHYVFADFQLRYLYVMILADGRNAGVKRIGTAPDYISSMGTDAQGNLYALGWEKGIIYQLDDPAFHGTGVPVRSLARPEPRGPFLLRGHEGPVVSPAWVTAGEILDLIRADGSRQAALRSGDRLKGIPPGTYIARIRGAPDAPARLVHLP